MWKAVLVLFLTSNTQPARVMIGQFPDSFVTKSKCLEFVSERKDEIDDTIKILTRHAKLKFRIIKHNLHCIEDTSGDPA